MKPVNIVIDDEHRYFSAGLRFSIMQYAQSSNIAVCFLTPGSEGKPDIVFASSARLSPYLRISCRAHIVIIKDKRLFTQHGVNREFFRSDNQLKLFDLLSEILVRVRYAARPFEFPALTSRENQVMSYLRRGLGQSQTARVMGVSVKTVHSHKRSVMSKLMLNRHHEFIYWLLSHNEESL